MVGLGFIATGRHLPIWKKQKNVELVGLCDVAEEVVKEATSRFKVPYGSTDVQQMIQEARPDIVDLCTPPRTHASIAKLAMEQKCHVILEKPMTVTSEECQSLVDCSAANNMNLCVIHNMLFYPPVVRALELVQKGEIGDLRGMRLLIANPVDEFLSKDNWIHKLPGGLIGETGPHVVYLSIAFIGKIHEVYAYGRKLSDYPWSSADDFIIDLVGERGSSSIRVIHNSNHWAGDLEVWGTEGKLKVDLQGMTLTRFYRKNLRLSTVGYSVIREAVGSAANIVMNAVNVTTGRFIRGHERIIEDFVNAIDQGSEIPVTLESAATTVSVLEEIVRQLSTGTANVAHRSGSSGLGLDKA